MQSSRVFIKLIEANDSAVANINNFIDFHLNDENIPQLRPL